MTLVSPVHRQLLIAAVGSPPAAVKAWAAWRQRYELDDAEWAQSRVFPLVARQLTAAGVDDPDLTRLRGVQRHSWAKNMALAADAVLATRLLDALGAPAMVLKGVGLQHAYPEPGLRTMGDADLLVQPRHARLAITAMSHAGWVPHGNRGHEQAAAIVRLEDSVGMRRSRRDIDLHWRPLHGLPLGVDAELWARRRERAVPGGTVWVPDPSHQLVLVLAHGLRRHSGAIVQGLCDAAMLLREGECDPEVAAHLASSWQRLTPLREGVESLTSDLGDPRFEEFARALRRLPGPTWRDRLQHSVAARPYDRRARVLERLSEVGRPEPAEPTVDPTVLPIGTRVRCNDRALLDLLRPGWGPVENWGIWTADRVARLAFEIDDPSVAVSFVLNAHAPSSARRQRVVVRINGRRVAVWRWPKGNRRCEQRIALPVGVRRIELELRMRALAQAAASDPRRLGLGVVWFELQRDRATPPGQGGRPGTEVDGSSLYSSLR